MTGAGRPRCYVKLRHAALGRKGQRRIQGALPLGIHDIHQAFGREAGNHGMCSIPQRQAISDQRQSGQVQLVGLELAPGWQFAFCSDIHHGCIAARPLQPVKRAKLQSLGRHVKAVGKMAPGKPPAHGL